MKLIRRAILAVLVLPVVFAGIIPVLLITIDPWRQPVFHLRVVKWKTGRWLPRLWER